MVCLYLIVLVYIFEKGYYKFKKVYIISEMLVNDFIFLWVFFFDEYIFWN